ncbi:uncharacterized protein BO66DRAFT_465086 [Aspergillus aculeatinus CBS 121060]|uniref:Uncharacterized protein n=1 Tax=Aspergillus aculeatinus CBS 121060 TaxID=1448322 RepID=A0ACD1GRX4_9EURO|nr:hypothetical protein BO66DRAFT_465086 [Aspergillus aculeatinus CBS 121060]RAH64165.1 hypothetical protein BO66DRAFT_465086 [Aspergillus aculeatinus CBS 121060]
MKTESPPPPPPPPAAADPVPPEEMEMMDCDPAMWSGPVPEPPELAIINLLNEAGVPCVLVGELALRAYGLSLYPKSIDLVVADENARRVEELLEGRGLALCFDRRCSLWNEGDKYFLSELHCHLTAPNNIKESIRGWKNGLLHIWAKSLLLEKLPNGIPLPSNIAAHDQNFMLTSDPRLPELALDLLGGIPTRWIGRWAAGVVILTPKAFLEQMFWHVLRDFRPYDAKFKSPWEVHMCRFALWIASQPPDSYTLCPSVATLSWTAARQFLELLSCPHVGHQDAWNFFFTLQGVWHREGLLTKSPRQGRQILQAVEDYALED